MLKAPRNTSETEAAHSPLQYNIMFELIQDGIKKVLASLKVATPKGMPGDTPTLTIDVGIDKEWRPY